MSQVQVVRVIREGNTTDYCNIVRPARDGDTTHHHHHYDYHQYNTTHTMSDLHYTFNETVVLNLVLGPPAFLALHYHHHPLPILHHCHCVTMARYPRLLSIFLLGEGGAWGVLGELLVVTWFLFPFYL